MTYLKPMQIGSLRMEENLALAPMAGTTDLVFRKICRELGAALTITELVSARGLVHDPQLQRTWRYIEIDPGELPVAIQLFGSEPDDFRRALELIFQHPILSQCSMIDLNMGCPVAKVVRSGDGCALMRDPQRAQAIIRACKDIARQAQKPVSVKFRKGWDDHSVNAPDFARYCQEAGADALTIHGRTRNQMYRGKADWHIIAAVKKAVSIPVFGNGDVSSGPAARQMLEKTGVDGVMIGRAAQGNPWIFQSIRQYLQQADAAGVFAQAGCRPDQEPVLEQPAIDQRIAMIIRHLDGLIERHGEYTAIREMRGQVAAYMKGIRHGGSFRARAVKAADRQELLAVLEDWRFYCQKSCEIS